MQFPTMRLRITSLRRVSQQIREPFDLQPIFVLGEYTLYLYRCEGVMPLHRHLDHEELFWPQDYPITLQSERGDVRVEAGEMAVVPRGWKHGSRAVEAAYVLLASRAERSFSLNGHHLPAPPDPPRLISPDDVWATLKPFEVQVLLTCDALSFSAERIEGTGATRQSGQGVWVIPLQGNIGVRCGAVVHTLAVSDVAAIPAQRGWHLFGNGNVVWATIP